MSDIRLDIGFLDHPKTIKLVRKLGWDKGVQSLLRLWCFASQYKCDGNLGEVIEDIELAAHWYGESGEFVNTLIEVGWIEQNGKGYLLHDWEQHNPWAYHAKERSDRAREAVKKRWERRTYTKRNTKRITKRNTPSPIPSPYPYPIPEDIKLDVWKAFVEMRKTMKAPFTNKAAELIISKLNQLHKDTGQDKNIILNQSIERGWAGVFQVKVDAIIEPAKPVDKRPIIYQAINGQWRRRYPDGREEDCEAPARGTQGKEKQPVAERVPEGKGIA